MAKKKRPAKTRQGTNNRHIRLGMPADWYVRMVARVGHGKVSAYIRGLIYDDLDDIPARPLSLRPIRGRHR